MSASGAQEDPVADCGTRERLRHSLIEAFSAQDEICRICLFGREAEGKHDRYSDIDMVVYSNDPARTKASYREVFSSISPIRATFTLGGTADSYSEMVMLRNHSPYHKVDFSIGDWGLWESRLLEVYASPGKSRRPCSTLPDVEIERDVTHVLTTCCSRWLALPSASFAVTSTCTGAGRASRT